MHKVIIFYSLWNKKIIPGFETKMLFMLGLSFPPVIERIHILFAAVEVSCFCNENCKKVSISRFPSIKIICLLIGVDIIIITSLILKFTWWNKLEETCGEQVEKQYQELAARIK